MASSIVDRPGVMARVITREERRRSNAAGVHRTPRRGLSEYRGSRGDQNRSAIRESLGY